MAKSVESSLISKETAGQKPILEKCGSDVKRKKVVRDYCFQKWEQPFGLNQRTVNLTWFLISHLPALMFFHYDFLVRIPFRATLFATVFGYVGGLGTTVGSHRYWTHRTFKAKLPLQILLMIMQTIAGQYPIHKWVLDHRIHHKYVDTNSDPHNSLRGFWFCHIGWLVLPKHKEHQEKVETFETPDLDNDPILRFQSQYYWLLIAIFFFGLPISILYYVWEISLVDCFIVNFIRYVMCLHISMSINSVAHMWGHKPYDKTATSVDNPTLAFFAVGEGWHNYHHCFPWDYRASEFGWNCNASAMFIDFFAWIGWAYDLKTTPENVIVNRIQRTGHKPRCNESSELELQNDSKEIIKQCEDGDEPEQYEIAEIKRRLGQCENPLWGWEDVDNPYQCRKIARCLMLER